MGDETNAPSSDPTIEPTTAQPTAATLALNENGEILATVTFEISGSAATEQWVFDNEEFLIQLFISSSNVSASNIEVSIGSVTQVNGVARRRMQDNLDGVNVEFLVTINEQREYNLFRTQLESGEFENEFDDGLTDDTFMN